MKVWDTEKVVSTEQLMDLQRPQDFRNFSHQEMYFSEHVDADDQAVIQWNFQRAPGFTNILGSLSLINVNKTSGPKSLTSKLQASSHFRGKKALRKRH